MERRTSTRIASRIRVIFLEKTRTETTTLNVSRNGIFVQDKGERPLNSLLRLLLHPPGEESAIELLGRVAWKGSVEDVKGVGVHFLKLDSDDRDRWIRFVSQVEALDALDPLAGAPEKKQTDRRSARRKMASFMVRFKTKARLDEFVSTNISSGGMFLETPVLKPEGEQVQIVIVHPDHDRDFEILAEITRVNPTKTESESKGMALKFLELTDETEKELREFLDSSD